jgi:hypothetical protein
LTDHGVRRMQVGLRRFPRARLSTAGAKRRRFACLRLYS